MSLHRKRVKSRSVESLKQMADLAKNAQGNVYIVDTADLHTLNPRPTLGTYVQQLWQRRFFIGAEARSKALRSTRDYRLWKLWLVVNPFLDVAMYGFLFGFLFKTSRGVENFLGFLIIGILFMRMLTGLLGDGSGLIQRSKGMISTFAFPRASLAFAQTLRAAIDNFFPALTAITLGFLTQWGNPPSWTLIMIVPLYVLLHIFGCGLMMITARLTAQIPDTKVLIGVFTTAWFFLSGVMFEPSRFQHAPVVQELMAHNPAYLFLTAIRETTIYTTMPGWDIWGPILAWTFGTFLVGFIFFWQAEDKYVRLA